jgi:Cu+-exporting ATPase
MIADAQSGAGLKRLAGLPGGGAHPASFERIDLAVEGMSCAACVRTVESSLNRLDGVHASVNLATETAAVLFEPEFVDSDQLLGAVRDAGYAAQVSEHPWSRSERIDPGSRLRSRLNVALALAGPMSLPTLVPRLRSRGWQWAYLAAAAPVVLWAGRPFHQRALSGLRHRAMTMDTLVSLGSLLGLGAGGAGVLSGKPRAYRHLEVAVGVTVSMLSGRVLEADARGAAGEAIRALLQAGPREASLLDDDGGEQLVAVDELVVGDRFLVRPGEAVPTDGVVADGNSAVDQSLVTGESLPVDVAPGDAVIGGAVNAGGPIVVTATRVGSDTALARIAQLVADAQLGKAPVQQLADRIASVFVPAVIAMSAGTLAVHLKRGESFDDSLQAAMAVLVVACPCALGLATPAALMVGVGRGAELGIFIRSPAVLESAHGVDVILLDKTGTLTTGAMGLVDVVADGLDRDEALRLAGAVEDRSEHPIGRAIAAAARDRFPRLPPAEGFRATTGFGVEATVDGDAVLVGRLALLETRGVAVPQTLRDAIERAEDDGNIAVLVGLSGQAVALLVVSDEIRPTSAVAVARLRQLGLHPILITGDQERTARAVARAVGIDEVIAEVLPEDKAAVVRRLQDEGHKVAVAGDGINDTPALARADLGLAVGSGTDVAIEASDLTLASADLIAAADAVRLARATFSTIRANLRWAAAYNLIALPAAAAGRLNPVLASASMATSSLVVIANSLRLRQFKTSRDD